MSRFEFRSILNYLVITIMVFMIALTAIFIYTSIHLKDKIIYRIVQQTELVSELITRAALDLMSAGHSGGKYSMILAYGNLIGVDDIGIFNLSGQEAFSDQSFQTRTNTVGYSPIRKIEKNEMESFLKAVAISNSSGFFNKNNKTYSSYVPLKPETACLSCHKKENEILGVLKIRLSTESDTELLTYMQNLIWRLWLIISLPVGALLIAGAIIREKNRLYSSLQDINQNLTNTYNDLNETEYYLQMILNNSKVIIVTTDIHGCIVEFNKEAEHLLEYTKEEVAGRDVLMLYENQPLRSEFGSRTGPLDNVVWEVRNRDVKLKSKSGRVYDVSLTLSTMVNDKGSIIGTVGIGKDISEQKMLQFKLLQSEKLAGIGTLASGIAHEINNPLAGILGMAEAVLDEEDIGLIKLHTKDIIQYTVNAKNIVRELSSYSRAAKNDTEMMTELDAVIDNSVKMARHSAQFANIEIITEFEEGCLIQANPAEMQQVFVNLIINAVHAMGEKGALVLRCRREGAFIKAVVSDTGHGIAEADLNHIYDPFFTTKPVGMGTGLGLYVVYRIIMKYRGSIDVESRVDKGTTFTLKFPVAVAPD